MAAPEELRADCLVLLRRFLLNYRDFPRDETDRKAAVSEYREWFLAKCASREEIAAIIDDAIQKRRRRPTIAELNDLYAIRYPTPEPAPQIVSTMPELTPEEQAQRDEFMREWRAQERAEAEERKQKWLETRGKRPAPQPRAPIIPEPPPKLFTEEDFERERERQRAAKEGGAE